MFAYELRVSEEKASLTVMGRIDYTEKIKWAMALFSLAETGAKEFYYDFEKLNFMDSATVNLFLKHYKENRYLDEKSKLKRKFVIFKVNDDIEEFFGILRLQQIIPIDLLDDPGLEDDELVEEIDGDL